MTAASRTRGLDGWVPWPDGVAARYRAAGYWRGETLSDVLRRQANQLGDRTAVVSVAGRTSYRALDRRASRLAAGLRRLGVHPRDRVVVQLPNVPAFFEVCFALFRCGAIPVMALPAHRHAEIAAFCHLTDAAAYVIPDWHGGYDYRELAARVEGAAPGLRHVLVAGDPGPFTALGSVDGDPAGAADDEPTADQVALLQLSGGSTGVPKLIPRTHDDYLYSVRASAAICELDADSAYLAVLPVAHNFTLSSPGSLGTLYAGGRVVQSPDPSPATALSWIERERIAITAVVPPLVPPWLDAARATRHDLSTLRMLQVGGAVLAPEIARRVKPTLGCTLQQVFGMAEGLVNYTRLDDPDAVIVGTQGRPTSPDDEIRIVDDDDRAVPAGRVGHLLTRGPYTIRGYYRAEDHNAGAFTADGFYRTGDLVRQTPTGHLVVEGRAKDQINRGGEKIAAEEVESHLLAHPAILAVAIVAMADAFLGERACAFVVPRGPAPTVRELAAFLRERGVAGFKAPDRVESLDVLPKTAVGKVNKTALRAWLADRLAPSAHP